MQYHCLCFIVEWSFLQLIHLFFLLRVGKADQEETAILYLKAGGDRESLQAFLWTEGSWKQETGIEKGKRWAGCKLRDHPGLCCRGADKHVHNGEYSTTFRDHQKAILHFSFTMVGWVVSINLSLFKNVFFNSAMCDCYERDIRDHYIECNTQRPFGCETESFIGVQFIGVQWSSLLS